MVDVEITQQTVIILRLKRIVKMNRMAVKETGC